MRRGSILLTTYVQTRDGKVYDLGKFQHPPKHQHPGFGVCPECAVKNAWCGPVVGDGSIPSGK